MDSKLLLVRGITLLYLESKRLTQNENSAILIRELVGAMKAPERTYETDESSVTHTELRNTLLWMANQPLGHKYDHTALLQRIRVNIKNDDGLWDAFARGMDEPDDYELLMAKITEMRNELKSHRQRTRLAEVIRKANFQVQFKPDDVDWLTLIPQLQQELEDNKPGAKQSFEAVTRFGSNTRTAVAEAIQKAIEQSSPEGVLRWGWQGVNQMMGELSGLRRGDMVVVGALTNNFKTGFTLNGFRQFCMHNKPFMLDPTKKPLMLHVSTENAQEDNMIILYAQMFEDEFQVKMNVAELKTEAQANPARYQEIANYVMDKLTATGYEVEFIRLNGPTTTYDKILELIAYYEAMGYEIHCIVFDYLNMCSKLGCHASTIGGDVRELFRLIRSFTNPKGITFLTPHQISSDAYALLRNNTDDFVKQIAKKGYWDSCRVLQQEVDLEILLHIEHLYGKSYLTIARGKHRKPLATPLEDLYCVYAFEEFGCIPDDVGKPNKALKKFGSDAPDHATEWM
jgi:hypothetical protein